jgi:hypothetical protein
MLTHPTDEDIRTKAYELWEQAGCPDGSAEMYWTEAEKLLSTAEETPSLE